jgi:hypothetical protein
VLQQAASSVCWWWCECLRQERVGVDVPLVGDDPGIGGSRRRRRRRRL